MAPALIKDIDIDPRGRREVAKEFREMLASGSQLRPAGTAKKRPRSLLNRGYGPEFRFRLFNAQVYFGGPWQNEDVRFFVAYVVVDSKPRWVFPRIFYKDVSLTWRCASHYVPAENWIGKGDVRVVMSAGYEQEESDEATTDLPLELHNALEGVARGASDVPYDRSAIGMVLRNAPVGRLEPYADFANPRAEALRSGRSLVNGARPIARFTRRNDPTSLKFVRGFEPDFDRGVLSRATLNSRLYGGRLERYRIASSNRLAQYQFVAARHHEWIASVQATSNELSTYCLRVVDAVVDEALLLPGFEYHFLEDPDDPTTLYSQIPDGYAGESSRVDASRADARAWLREVPALQTFRKRLQLGGLGGLNVS